MNKPLKNISILENFVSFVALILVLAFAMTACDSGGDSLTDSERIVDSWDANRVDIELTPGVNVELISASLAGVPDVSSVTAEYGSDDSFRIMILSPDSSLADLQGSYTIDESAKTISHTNAEISDPLIMEYDFVTADQVRLKFSGSDLLTLGLDIPGIDESTLGQVNGLFDRQ